MKNCVQTLPEGYRETLFIDLQQDKKTALLVNAIGALVMVALFIEGHFIVPISAFFSMEDGLGMYFLRLLVMIGGMLAYFVLHELTHAAAMKAYGAGKLRFGFTGLYAFAGSEGDYFGKRAYRVIALAPLVVWTLLLAVLVHLAPPTWFWVVWFIQVSNVAGAAGDVYVTLRLLPLPADILVRDTGVNMTVYSR